MSWRSHSATLFALPAIVVPLLVPSVAAATEDRFDRVQRVAGREASRVLRVARRYSNPWELRDRQRVVELVGRANLPQVRGPFYRVPSTARVGRFGTRAPRRVDVPLIVHPAFGCETRPDLARRLSKLIMDHPGLLLVALSLDTAEEDVASLVEQQHHGERCIYFTNHARKPPLPVGYRPEAFAGALESLLAGLLGVELQSVTAAARLVVAGNTLHTNELGDVAGGCVGTTAIVLDRLSSIPTVVSVPYSCVIREGPIPR